MRPHRSIAALLALAALGCAHAEVAREEERLARQFVASLPGPVRQLELRGSRLRFVDLGAPRPDRDPLLFIHGIGGSIDDFGPLLATAAGHDRVLAFDLPGFGESSNGALDFTIGAYARTVHEFLAVAGLSRVHLVCHSMGGQICIEFTLHHADQVASLTLIDAAGTYDPHSFVTRSLKRVAGLNIGKVDSNSPPALGVLTSINQGLLKRVFIDEATPLAGLASFTTNLREQVRELQVPVLIVWGTEDGVFPVEEAFFLRENIPLSRLHLVDGEGHLPFARSDLIDRWLLELLAAVPQASPRCTSQP